MAAEPVQWLGRCDACGEPSPEVRDSEAEALADADACPCREVTGDD